MRTSWIVAIGLGVPIAATGCEAPQPELESARKPIISGPLHTGDPAIMELLSFKGNLGSRCTASLITPRLLIAAAHCIVEAPGFDRFIFPGNDDTNVTPQDTLAVKTVVYDQRYGAPRQGNDFAIIVLEKPVAIPPMRLNRASVDNARGKNVRYVGYGLSVVGNPNSGGIKRQHNAPLAMVSRLLLTVGPNAHVVCKGDSGGPLLLDDGQGESIIGISSFVDAPACRNNAWYQRVDTQLAWIDEQIAKFDPGGMGPPGDGGTGGMTDAKPAVTPDAGASDVTTQAPPPSSPDAHAPSAGTTPPMGTQPMTSPPETMSPPDARPADSARPATTPPPAAVPNNFAEGGGCSVGSRPNAGLGSLVGLMLAVCLAARRRSR